jgi:hypothetical protein
MSLLTKANKDLQNEYKELFIEAEKIELGFKLSEDIFMFTSKRLLIVNTQNKIEYKSLPYTRITKFSLEAAEAFGLNAELKIWMGSELQPTVSKRFNKEISVYEVQRYLASKVL